ncbi:MAG: sugar phosphate nucleotidyltransferase, partial [Terriglobales bacterium]
FSSGKGGLCFMQGRSAMKAMVLAAGVGSRLDPLTSQVPKPLVPVVNVPVMQHILQLLGAHGFTDICANLHYLPEKIVEYFGDGTRFGINLHFKHEPKLSGDAGGVRSCRSFLEDGTFIVLMGDLLTDADLSAIVNEHKAKKALASIAVKAVPHEELHRFGVVVRDKDGFITGFQEKPQAEEALSNMISTGIYVFEPEVFEHIPAEGEYGFGRQLFPKLVQDGLPVLGIEIKTYWSDVGTIAQYRESNFDALQGLVKLNRPGTKKQMGAAEVWLGEGATIDDGCTLSGTIMIGKNSKIGRGTTLSGSVILGDDCIVEPNSSVHDSVVWSGCRVQSGAHLEGSVLGYNCIVGSGSKHIEVASVAAPVSPRPICAV